MRVLLLLIIFYPLFGFAQNHSIAIGEKLPVYSKTFLSSEGEILEISNLKNSNGILIIFTSNTCPFVKEWSSEFFGIQKSSKENKIGMVLINSNSGYRNSTESVDEMLRISKENGYADIPYLVDEKSEFASLLGANTTPHVFLFNSDNELIYKGAIDDKFEQKDRKATKHYLLEAIISTGENKKPYIQETNNIGCSIKRTASNKGRRKGYQVVE